jgi:hypothetical protein
MIIIDIDTNATLGMHSHLQRHLHGSIQGVATILHNPAQLGSRRGQICKKDRQIWGECYFEIVCLKMRV